MVLFSVIVAVKNNKEVLQRCINSINCQTYLSRELIIIDGESTDGTLEVIHSNNKNIDFWLSEPDSGVYCAFNKAINYAKGDWLIFLGSDDILWSENVLEYLAGQIDQLSSNIKMLYGQVAVLNERNDILRIAGEPWEETSKKFTNYMSLPHQGVVHHCSLFEKYGKYDETFQIAGDYDFLLRVLTSNNLVFIRDFIIVGMQQGGISNNRKNRLLSLRESYRARRKNNIDIRYGKYLFYYFKTVILIITERIVGQKITEKILSCYRSMFKVYDIK